MKIDMHMHTHYSRDSINSLNGLVKKCRELGITPAITDHNTIAAHGPLRKMGFAFIPGEEIKTSAGDLIGLYIGEAVPKGTPYLEAVDRIREQGGLCYVPHMYDWMREGIGDEELAKKADIVEVYNPRCISSRHNEMASEFAKRNGKIGAAGSDSHFTFEIGGTCNECKNFDVSEPAGLIKALKSGKIIGSGCWVPRPALRVITQGITIAKKTFGIGKPGS